MGEPSLTIISLIARMCQPSCQTNPIISIIPFLGFQIKKKKSFVSLSPLFNFRSWEKIYEGFESSVDFVPRIPDQFDQRNLDRRGWHRDTRAFSSTLDRRPRWGSFSLFSHPARGYDALRILEGRGRTRSGSATEKRTRREGTEVRSQSREPDRPRHRRRISTELEFKLARPVGDVTQYFRFRRTRIAANDVNAPSSSSSPLVVARNVALSFSSCFSGQGQVARAVHCN